MQVSDDRRDPTSGELMRTLVRIEAKLDSTHADHEARIRFLEKCCYCLPPSLVVSAVSLYLGLRK